MAKVAGRNFFAYFVKNKAISRFTVARRCYSDDKRWQLHSAVCVQRLPVISQEKTPIELEMSKMLAQIEFENSLRSNHELRKEADKYNQQTGNKEIDEEEGPVIQTAHDFEDDSLNELKQFQLASRLTEADKAGDKTSTQRFLDKYLYLVLDTKVGKDSLWMLPYTSWKEGETMRQTAERALTEHCGDYLKCSFLGLAPVGFYKYKYPKGVSSYYGSKLFFFKATLKGGQMKEKAKFQWLTRNELSKVFVPQYQKSVFSFLVDDTPIQYELPSKLVLKFDPRKHEEADRMAESAKMDKMAEYAAAKSKKKESEPKKKEPKDETKKKKKSVKAG